ncbi:MAG: alpha/beta hydrolase [Myxococcales bacterium]|nr:alpha/beta hydrolase [Myxococcales bacterium]
MTLSFQTVMPPGGAAPRRWALVLHGILGSKTNWRTLVQRAAAAAPAWGFVLADLRNHGDSQGLDGDDTLAAAAADLEALLAARGHGADLVVGHSYGGKVALTVGLRGVLAPSTVMVVDSNPGPRPDLHGSEDTLVVLKHLGEVGVSFAQRDDFIAAMVALGHTAALATWLATNLVHRDGALSLRLDLARIRAMLDDYFARDLWPFVEAPEGPRLRFLLGGKSEVLDDGERARLKACAARGTRVSVEVIAAAGHWVHVDAPRETVGALADALKSAE